MMRETRAGPGLTRTRVRAAFKATTLPLVDVLVATRVSANAVTGCSLLVGAASGLALVYGNFGWATLGLLIACVGDALDGPVARRTETASTAGALFDASADRYQEFFAMGGLALFFRASEPVLALVLFALVGSFMVSYGSAKAEAAGVPVPPSVMRRPERAAVLWLGVALTAATHLGIPVPDFEAGWSTTLSSWPSGDRHGRKRFGHPPASRRGACGLQDRPPSPSGGGGDAQRSGPWSRSPRTSRVRAGGALNVRDHAPSRDVST